MYAYLWLDQLRHFLRKVTVGECLQLQGQINKFSESEAFCGELLKPIVCCISIVCYHEIKCQKTE